MPARDSSLKLTVTLSQTDDMLNSPKPAGRAPHDRTSKTMLFISPTAEDHAALRQITSSLDWEVSIVTNFNEARDKLRQAHVSVILCESALEDGTWKDILHHIAESARPPRLIVTSRLADEYLWAEVLNLGGYDVLAEPFSEGEVSHVLTTISLSRAPAPATRTAGAA